MEVTAADFAIPASNGSERRLSDENARIAPEAVKDVVSFFELEGAHVVLETCKPAFDRKDGVVLRLYESKGCAGTTQLVLPQQTGCTVKQAYFCNMLEEPERELEVEDGRLRLSFRAFEIKTVLLVKD